MSSSLKLAVVVSPPFEENTWIAWRADRQDCVLFDPGFQPERLLAFLDKQRLTPAAVLLTHGHVDHIAGNAAVKRRWPAVPLVIGRDDAPLLANPRLNMSALGGVSVTSPPADRLVDDLDLIDAAGLCFRVRSIPGHSPGHVVYCLLDDVPPADPIATKSTAAPTTSKPTAVRSDPLADRSVAGHVFGGDVLFQGSIGRCDFPGGDQHRLVTGIREKLFCLPDDTTVYPGHGDPTTIAHERRSNPYCGEHADD